MELKAVLKSIFSEFFTMAGRYMGLMVYSGNYFNKRLIFVY